MVEDAYSWSVFIRAVFDRFLTALRRPPGRQVAALCYRDSPAGREILLVTSRTRQRWIVPKGWPIRGLSDAEAAAREAFEEAGVSGRVAPEPLGSFDYRKRMGHGLEMPCRAAVFAIEVTHLAARYPEHKQRQRQWYPAREAAFLVAEPGLRALVEAFSRPPEVR